MGILEILKQVNEIFIEEFEDDNIQINYETTAKDIDEWDSLNHIMLVVAIEKQFLIKFTTAEVQGFNNVGQMCEFINKKLND